MESSITTEYSWEQTKALAAIHEAGREIAASLDLDRTLRLVMQKAAETLPMDAGVLFVRNEALQRYYEAGQPNRKNALPNGHANSKANGSGLGLAVSHEIIANHGGELTIHSEPGAGAIFTVMLPVTGED